MAEGALPGQSFVAILVALDGSFRRALKGPWFPVLVAVVTRSRPDTNLAYH
jgi:hypothetical protein